MKRTLLSVLAALCLSCATFAAEEPVNEQDPILLFEKRYNHGTNAVLDKNWVEAQRHFEAALAALGQRDHIKKQAVQILLKKSQEEGKKQRAMFTANELLRLNQYKEAEEAFLAAKAELGDTEEIRLGLEAVRQRRDQEPKQRAMTEREKEYMLAMREANEQVEERKYESARIFAERARALRPDDRAAGELIREIDRRVRGEKGASLPRQEPNEVRKPVPIDEKPIDRSGDL